MDALNFASKSTICMFNFPLMWHKANSPLACALLATEVADEADLEFVAHVSSSESVKF